MLNTFLRIHHSIIAVIAVRINGFELMNLCVFVGEIRYAMPNPKAINTKTNRKALYLNAAEKSPLSTECRNL